MSTPTSSLDLPAAVLCDMDGTLVDSEVLWDQGLRELAPRIGVELTEELRASTIGNSLRDSITKLYRYSGQQPTETQIAQSGQWLVDRVGQLVEHQLEALPGVADTLQLLAHAGIPLAVVTNTGRTLTERMLPQFAYGPSGVSWFSAVVTFDDVAAGKPAPDPYLHACTLLGVDPDDTLAIEDSVAGSAAATAAGCPTLIVGADSPVPAGPLRVFRDSLQGLTLPEIQALYRAARQPVPAASSDTRS